MKRLTTRLWITFTIFVIVFFMTSCAATPSSASASPDGAALALRPAINQQGQQGRTPTPTSAPLAARINGQPITLVALDREVTRRLDGIKALGEQPPADLKVFRAAILDSLIEQNLIEQAAAAQKVQVTDAEVEAEVQATISIAGNREKWLNQLKLDNLTEAEYRAGLRSALLTQKMRDIVTKNICVNVEQVLARHILVADEATATAIKTQIDKGADFAALAQQYSLDVTTRQIGGDLGYFARGQLLQKSVEDAAFSLEKNAISGPIKSELGYHIIQVLDRVKDRPLDPEVCSELTQTAFENWVKDLVNKAKIEKFG